jgi:regulator of sirC expression with transglutaminase-like and TPR domain
MGFDPLEYLNILSALPDPEIDIGPAALALAAQDQPGLSLDRYLHHLKKIANETGARHEELLKAGAQDNNETRLAALKHILADKYSYAGDEESYDDLQNASLIRVIDRAKGLPITLAILYMHAARAQGWDIAGLNVPGHFVCRLEKDGARLIFDPFHQCRVLAAADLRQLVKKVLGENAELSATYFEPAGNREILIRLQNNIKFRQIEMEDYAGALKTVEIMRLVAPAEYRLLLDAGVLYARTQQIQDAIDVLEDYIKQAPYDRDRHDAALLLQQLKESLI